VCRGCFKIYNLTNIFQNVPQYFLIENTPFLPVLYLNQLLELNTKISVVKGKSRIKFYFPRHPFFSSFNRCIMFRGESIQKIIVKNYSELFTSLSLYPPLFSPHAPTIKWLGKKWNHELNKTEVMKVKHWFCNKYWNIHSSLHTQHRQRCFKFRHLSVCQFFSLSVCQSVILSVCHSVSLSVCQSVSLSVFQSVSFSVFHSLSLSVSRISVSQSLSLSVSQSLILSVSQSLVSQSPSLSVSQSLGLSVSQSLSFSVCQSVSLSVSLSLVSVSQSVNLLTVYFQSLSLSNWQSVNLP